MFSNAGTDFSMLLIFYFRLFACLLKLDIFQNKCFQQLLFIVGPLFFSFDLFLLHHRLSTNVVPLKIFLQLILLVSYYSVNHHSLTSDIALCFPLLIGNFILQFLFLLCIRFLFNFKFRWCSNAHFTLSFWYAYN